MCSVRERRREGHPRRAACLAGLGQVWAAAQGVGSAACGRRGQKSPDSPWPSQHLGLHPRHRFAWVSQLVPPLLLSGATGRAGFCHRGRRASAQGRCPRPRAGECGILTTEINDSSALEKAESNYLLVSSSGSSGRGKRRRSRWSTSHRCVC